MIVHAKNEHTDEVIKTLRKEPELNLFLIGDIENFGIHRDFQDVWFKRNSKGEIEGILLRYYRNYLPWFDPEIKDLNWMKDLVDRDKKAEIIIGAARYVRPLVQTINETGFELREGYFACLEEIKPLDPAPTKLEMKRATIDDLDAVYEIIDQIPEFIHNETTRESTRVKFETNTGRSFYYKVDDKIVSIASSTAENSVSAMIVGVATLDPYRRKGLASNLTYALCEELLQEGKTLCLFYDNPKAGDIYKRMGFYDKDRWMVATFK